VKPEAGRGTDAGARLTDLAGSRQQSLPESLNVASGTET
jgi:hypothetical protein